MSTPIWNAEDYATHGRFVADHGVPVLELLEAQPNESPELVASARKLGLHVVECDASDMDFSAEFDAVFRSPQPDPLPGDVMTWLTALGRCFTAALPQDERGDYLECVRKRIETRSSGAEGPLAVGAFALRFKARLTALAKGS